MKKFIASLLAAASLIIATPAVAGTVKVHDSVGILSEDDIQTLEHEDRWNFELHVLVKNGDLAESTERAVTGANVMAIGIDPVNHRTSVRHGSQVSIPAGVNLSQMGNEYFKQRKWVGGIEAIASQASLVIVSQRQVNAEEATSKAERETFTHEDGHPFLWFLLFAGLIGCIIYVFWRSNRARSAFDDSYVAPVRTGYAPSYRQISAPAPQATPSTTIINNGSNNDGLSTLVGYELGRQSVQPVTREIVREEAPRTRVREAPARSDDDSSWSSSKSKDDSSWDSSSSSSSSSDDSSWGGSTGGSGGGGDDSSW